MRWPAISSNISSSTGKWSRKKSMQIAIISTWPGNTPSGEEALMVVGIIRPGLFRCLSFCPSLTNRRAKSNSDDCRVRERSACWPRPMVMCSSSPILMDGIEQEICWWMLLNYFPVSLRFQGLIKIRSCTHTEEIRDGAEEEDQPWPSEAAAAAILQIKRYHFVTCNFPMICCCRKRIPTTTDHHHQHDRNNRLVHVLIICRSQFVCRQSLYSVARRNKERNQRWIRK